ncbi:MAG: hypothetical protein K2P80_11455 [Beijerinckiaceae bacterium]|nr:hypothetical protein [Beijerinckiaceae bacterium]
MKLRIFVNPSRLRRWHLSLAHRLIAVGHDVAFAFAEGGPTLPAALNALLRLERRLYGLKGDRPSERLPFEAAGSFLRDMPNPDLIIDLTVIGAGRGQAADRTRILSLSFDGDRSEMTAVGAIIGAHQPMLRVTDGDGGVLAIGRPALEKPYVLARALDEVFTRAVTLLLKAVAGHAVVLPTTLAETGAVRPTGATLIRFGLTSFFARLAVALGISARESTHWRIGWRRVDDGFHPLSAGGRWSPAGHRWLPDDGKRYFADPFAFEHDGRTVIFCEEVPASTGKGIISRFEVDAEGRPGRPTIVLERPYHLSYPFVFEHEGEIFMIPETLANRTVELYRAESFPDRWSLDTVLISGVAASDATLIRHHGRFWLFATEEDGGSTWDCLSIWHAETLRGPWLAHPMNPVLVDAAGARPAGPIIAQDGVLMRPAQDCTGFYGRGLVMKEITRLDAEGFDEREAVLSSNTSRTFGIHTVSRSRDWQFIDSLAEPTHGSASYSQP